jgi:hypothetical protein
MRRLEEGGRAALPCRLTIVAADKHFSDAARRDGGSVLAAELRR